MIPDSDDTPKRKKGVSFNAEISIGNLISLTAFVVMVTLSYFNIQNSIEKEVVLRNEQRLETLARFDREEQQHRDELAEIKQALARIETKLDEKADKR